jgi:hypothetical protein
MWDAEGVVMNTTETVNSEFESTYTLIVRSEEKGRGLLELAVYAAFLLSVVFTIYQFAQTPLTTSAPESKPCVACHTTKSDVRGGI